MDTVIQQIFSPAFLILGVSRILHPNLWIDLIANIGKSRFAGFWMGSFALTVGLFLILGHNKWVLDWPLLITVVGWGMAIKGTIYLLVPKAAEVVIERAGKSNRVLRVSGIVMAAFGGVLSWQVFVA